MALVAIATDTDVDNILGVSQTCVLFKHSPACGASARALGEVQAFGRAHPRIPVWWVDVLSHRDVSNRLAARLGVRHQSPQIIVVAAGIAKWHASHFGISAQRIAAACLVATTQAPDSSSTPNPSATRFT